jgi:hypothetical protein
MVAIPASTSSLANTSSSDGRNANEQESEKKLRREESEPGHGGWQ